MSLRFDGELFFANATHFAQVVRYIDTTASDVLSELIDELAALDVSLALARVKAPLHERLRASGVEQALGEERLYANVRAGVDDYLSRHPGLQPTSQTSAR